MIGVYSAYKNITSFIPVMTPEIKFDWGDAVFFAVLALFFIFFSRYQRAVRFSFKLFLVLIVFSGTSMVASSVLGPLWDIWATFLVVAVFLLIKNVLVHNIGMILGIAGIGSLLGLAISPGTAVIIMIVLSLYDIIAVYATKHMIKMAKAMMESGAIFGFIIPSQMSGFFHTNRKLESGLEASL